MHARPVRASNKAQDSRRLTVTSPVTEDNSSLGDSKSRSSSTPGSVLLGRCFLVALKSIGCVYSPIEIAGNNGGECLDRFDRIKSYSSAASGMCGRVAALSSHCLGSLWVPSYYLLTRLLSCGGRLHLTHLVRHGRRVHDAAGLNVAT